VPAPDKTAGRPPTLEPILTIVNARTFFSLPLLVLLVLAPATRAGAASSPGYGLAYGWDTERQRVVEYRQRVASLLALTGDSRLRIVGRDQEYGVVWDLKATAEQARKIAEQQNAKLRRAGLKPVQPIKNTSFSNLYQVGVAQASNPATLKDDYARLQKGLGAHDDNLVIEKIGSGKYALVYRCWESKADALKIARHHATLLPNKKGAPFLIPAVDRPAVQVPSAVPEGQQGATREAPPMVQKGREQSRPEATGCNGKMEALLREEIRKGRIQSQVRTGWAAYDLTTNTYLVSINLYRPFQAASMIKPFVALAFFHLVDKGKLAYTPQHRRMMEEMIQHSSNQATNWFIRQVGGPARCEALLKKEYGNLVQQVRIKEYIPPDGRTYQNSVQPLGYIQFLKALWNYQLPNSKEMLRVMSLPGPDRLVYGTEVPGNTEIYNKTGTTSLLCGDMGILVARAKDGRKIPYAIVGIVERPTKPADYKQWMHAGGDVIRDFSSLVYEEMKRKHDLL